MDKTAGRTVEKLGDWQYANPDNCFKDGQNGKRHSSESERYKYFIEANKSASVWVKEIIAEA